MASSEHQVIADLLADILQETRTTNDRIASLAVAIANAGQGSPAVRAETAKVIEKAAKAPDPKPVPAPAAAPSEPVAPVAESPAPTAPSEPAISYAQVSKAIQDMVKVDREKVLAALAKFQVKRGSELSTEQYPEFMEALA